VLFTHLILVFIVSCFFRSSLCPASLPVSILSLGFLPSCLLCSILCNFSIQLEVSSLSPSLIAPQESLPISGFISIAIACLYMLNFLVRVKDQCVLSWCLVNTCPAVCWAWDNRLRMISVTLSPVPSQCLPSWGYVSACP